jgi:hypothetical protein
MLFTSVPCIASQLGFSMPRMGWPESS